MRALALLLVLTACTSQTGTAPGQNLLAKLQTFTADDLKHAADLANFTGDKNGADCWTFLASLIPTISPPEPIGAATAIEIARLGQQSSFVSQCKQTGVVTGLPAVF